MFKNKRRYIRLRKNGLGVVNREVDSRNQFLPLPYFYSKICRLKLLQFLRFYSNILKIIYNYNTAIIK